MLVKTLDAEDRLRHLEWIEANRKRVDEASSGRIGYIYVPSTGIDGQTELVRQFMAQFDKDGLIIDERFNSGGQIPDRFIELLNRKPLAFWAVRDGVDWQWPPTGQLRTQGDAHQRLERVRRRRLPGLLPQGRPRAAHRDRARGAG